MNEYKQMVTLTVSDVEGLAYLAVRGYRVFGEYDQAPADKPCLVIEQADFESCAVQLTAYPTGAARAASTIAALASTIAAYERHVRAAPEVPF